ncbi:hypothetical protein ACYQR9_23065 [Methylobacterium sp. CM6241]
MTLHNLVASKPNSKPSCYGYGDLHAEAKPRWRRETSQSRGPAEPYNDKPRCGPPSGNSTDGETVCITVLRRWKRSHKGLDPASAATLDYLIGVATKGVATCRQDTIAARTSLSVGTVKRRLAMLEHLGLITRTKRYGTNGHRKCDAVKLELDSGQVKLSPEQIKALVKRFHGPAGTRGDASISEASSEAGASRLKHPGAEQDIPKGSYFPPVQDSSATPQSPDAVSAERGSDAPATPSISLTGDQRISSEESRPSTDQGSAHVSPLAPADDSDIDAADGVYRDHAPWADDGDGEFASLPQADSASHEPPVSRPARAPASTPPAPATRPAKTKRSRSAGLDAAGVPILADGTPNWRAIIWTIQMPALQALHKHSTGGYMTQAAARGRMGRIIKQISLKETAILMSAVLKVGPAGNPFDYAAKMMLGEAISLATATDSLHQPIRYI